jgi:putative transposase
LFGKTRQAYHAQRKHREQSKIQREAIAEAVLTMVRDIRKKLPSLGTRKLFVVIKHQLEAAGIRIGRDRFFALLRQHNLLIRPDHRHRVTTTNSKHWMKKYPNLIRDMTVTRPNELWVADITYVRLEPEFRYLSLLTDAYSHKIVGYALSKGLDTAGPLDALRQALRQRKSEADGTFLPMIHHSDRGVQYCSKAYTELLQSHQVQISMTENGDPYENAIAERLNGILKYEFDLISGFENHGQMVKQLKQAVRLYNDERPHASCDYLTPSIAHKTNGPLRKHWSQKNYNHVK